MASHHPAAHMPTHATAPAHAPVAAHHATATTAGAHPGGPSSPVEHDPFSDRTREHNRYKISQDNHAMALRRVQHGDDVDKGFYGRVNPNPPGVNNDPPETQLMNLQEAKYHATNEIAGRNAFNQQYYGGNHQGIDEQVRLRQQQVDGYNQKINRLQNHIDNPPPPLPQQQQGHAGNPTGHPMAGQGPPGWLHEQENGEEEFDGTHEQDHEPMTIGHDVQHPGMHSNAFDDEDEGHYDEEGFGDEDEHDPDHYHGDEDEHNLYGT